MSKIDYTKPIKARSSFEGNRDAFVLRVFANDTALVAVDRKDAPNPIIFGPEGEFVGCPNHKRGADCGSALTVYQVEEPPREHTLTLTAEEMALLYVLVGTCFDGHPVSGSLYDKIALPYTYERYLDCKAVSAQAATVNLEGAEWKRLVEEYK